MTFSIERTICPVVLPLFLVALFAALGADAGGAQTRELTADPGNLAGAWLFRTDPDDVGEREGWQAPAFQDTGWRTLRAPATWEEQGVTDPRPGQPPRPKNGMPWSDYDGVAWYRLHFVVPRAWAGQDLVLRLGSVDDEDRTFLNGRLVGETGRGMAQAVSIQRRYRAPAALVRFGEENVIAVRVYDGGGPGGILGPELSLLPASLLEGPVSLPTPDRPLEARFAEPAAANRILKIIHSWPDAPGDQDELIHALAYQGFGGVVCNVSFEQYLRSEAKWKAFVRAVRQAKAAGMSLWLYDERGYPSGTAGGLVLKDHPDWQARGLLVADAVSRGGLVHLDAPPGVLVAAVACPEREGSISMRGSVDLKDRVRNGKLEWRAPAGRWRVIVVSESPLYEGTHSSVSLGDKIPYIDLMNPEPTRRFLQVTHEQYAERLGHDLGKFFVSTFTDEPSLMSLFLRPMPVRVLPWTPRFAEEFARRRGHPMPPLPLLVADDGPAGRKARYEYWSTVGDLVSENYFGQIGAWCSAHGVLSGGHLLMEESLVASVPLYGDFLECARRLTAPSIDCLTSVPAEVPWSIARLISSAAELEGRTVTMCETSDFSQVYRPAGDTRPKRDVTLDEIRGAVNRLMLGGITTITSYYTWAGLDSAKIREANEWVGRCTTLLGGGHQAADIAVVRPTESVWVRFVPSRSGVTDAAAAAAIEAVYHSVSDALYAARRDFTYLDARALAQARAASGSLALGRLRWRIVVLPRVDTLPLAAWLKLAAFVRSGGVAVAVGALPANSETEFPSARVLALSRELFGTPAGPHVQANARGGAGIYLPEGSESLLTLALDRVAAAEVTVDDPRAPVRATHRVIDGHSVFFLINDGPERWQGRVSVAAAGPGERWDPATGRKADVAGPAGIALDLPPYGAVVLRFGAGRLPPRHALRTGGLPGIVLRPLPAATPRVAHGEFVRASLSADPARSQPGAPAWKAVGTLTKANTDTFLFVTAPYPTGLDLGGADCLALDVWTPDGQSAATQLLVMAVDRSGRTFYAPTGCPLSTPGHRRLYLPRSAFAPAPWASGPAGSLDWSAIVAINVGWGGYFGDRDEKIEFSLALPRAGSAGRQ